jgi:hypothetical protein
MPFPSPIHATCPAHIILLNFVTCTIVCEEYRSWSSSLWSFLHSHITLFPLGPDIPLNIPILKHPQPTCNTICKVLVHCSKSLLGSTQNSHARHHSMLSPRHWTIGVPHNCVVTSTVHEIICTWNLILLYAVQGTKC